MSTRTPVRRTAMTGVGCSARTLKTAAVKRPLVYDALMLNIANMGRRFDDQTNARPPGPGALPLGASGRGVSHDMSAPYTVSGGGAVDLPGVCTPAQRDIESNRGRKGRPHALGNLADDRCRSCQWFRPRDSHRPTAHRRHGHRPSQHDPRATRRPWASQRRPDDHEGMTTHPEYTLAKPPTCLNNRDHFTRRFCPIASAAYDANAGKTNNQRLRTSIPIRVMIATPCSYGRFWAGNFQ